MGGDVNFLFHDYSSGYKGIRVSKQIKLYTLNRFILLNLKLLEKNPLKIEVNCLVQHSAKSFLKCVNQLF